MELLFGADCSNALQKFNILNQFIDNKWNREVVFNLLDKNTYN